MNVILSLLGARNHLIKSLGWKKDLFFLCIYYCYSINEIVKELTLGEIEILVFQWEISDVNR